MSAEQPPSVSVRRYRQDDERAVLELLQAAFGSWPRGIEGTAKRDFFRWKTLRCPFGDSLSLVAEHEEQIVGFVARLLWPLRVAGRDVMSIRGMDLAVDPAWRRHGVSLALMDEILRSEPATVALNWNNPNRLSRGGVLKVGDRRTLSFPWMVSPGRGLVRALASRIARRPQAPDPPAVLAPTAAQVLSDEAFVSALLAWLRPPDERLETARTAAYLRWRYGHFDTYHGLRVGASAEDGGIVIFRLLRRRAFWLCEVCELLTPRDRVARELLSRTRRAVAADVLRCVFPTRRQGARCGFVPQLGAIELTVRPGPARDTLPRDPALRSSWALSLGDLELL